MSLGPNDERIDIEVVMSDRTSPAAENVERKIKDIGDESEVTSDKVEDLGVQSDKSGRKWRRFGLTLRRSRKDIQNAGDDAEKTAEQVKQIGDEAEATEKKVAKSSRSMSGSFGGIGRFFRRIMRPLTVFKWGLIADGIGLLANAIIGLGAAGYAGIAGLSPIAGTLGAIPGMVGTAVQSFGTLAIAVSGVGGAIAAAMNPETTAEEWAKATEKLHEEQIKFATSVATTASLWAELRKEVGGRFFKELGPLYLMLTKQYQPLFNKQLGETADIWNDIIHHTGDFLASRSGLKLVGDVMEHNNDAMRAGSTLMTDSLRLLLATSRAAGPMVTSMTRDFTNMIGRGADWAEANQQRMQDFFNRSYDLTLRVGDALGDLFVGLYNIGKLSKPLSAYMGKGIEDGLKRFREWTESKGGQKSITEFFRKMRPVVRELTLWVGTLWNAIGDIALEEGTFVKWSQALRTEVVPALVDLFDALQGWALPTILKLVDIYENLKDAKIIGGTAAALDAFADAILAVTDAATELPEAVKNMLGLSAGLYAGYKILNRGLIGKGLNRLTGGRFGNAGGAGSTPLNPMYVVVVGNVGPGGGGVLAGPGGKHKAGKHKNGRGPVLFGGGKGTSAPKHRAPVVAAPKYAEAGKRAARGRVPRFLKGLGIGGLAAGLVGSAGIGHENDAINAGGWALTGGSVGALAGPLGAAAGAGLGGLFGYVGRKDSERRTDMDFQNTVRTKGGSLDQMFNEYDRLQKKIKEVQAQEEAWGKTKFTGVAIGNLQDDVDQLDSTFSKLTGHSLSKFKTMLGTLPKDVQTKITTPGLLDTQGKIDGLLARYDMTPKEKQTVIRLLGADENMTKMRHLNEYIRQLRDKTIKITVERWETERRNGTSNMPKPGQYELRYAGGPTLPGRQYLVGEVGAEAWVSKTGAIKMLGLRGPELVRPGAGAVVPTTATRDPFRGDSKNAPDWAVAALQRATGGKGHLGRQKAAAAPSNNTYSVSVSVNNPRSDVDVTRAVKKALRDIENERLERG